MSNKSKKEKALFRKKLLAGLLAGVLMFSMVATSLAFLFV